ncbi:protein of unknown function [Paraburkholderia kururiensis]
MAPRQGRRQYGSFVKTDGRYVWEVRCLCERHATGAHEHCRGAALGASAAQTALFMMPSALSGAQLINLHPPRKRNLRQLFSPTVNSGIAIANRSASTRRAKRGRTASI